MGTVVSSAKRRTPSQSWSTWRRIAQVAVLAWAFFAGLRHVILAGSGSIEASCPFGAVETAWSLLVEGTYLRHLAPSNGIALALVALSAVALGRVFCGWVCPIGTLQDALAGLARRLTDREAGFPWRVPRAIDRPLRYLKYVVLGWVLLASITAVVPPLAPFCPFRTLFEFNLGSVLSFGIILSLATTSLLVERFWCRYLCPLGALLALLNRVSPIRPRVDGGRCVACGRCEKSCPAGIDPVDDGTNHPECVRCFACVDACRRPGALGFRRQAAVDGNARNA